MPLFKLIVNRFSLIVLFIISSFILLTSHFAPRAYAQACTTPATSAQQAVDQINKCAIEKDTFDDKIFNLNQIGGTMDSLVVLLSGRSMLHPETNQITQNSGALAASGNLVAAMYAAPPVSGVQYFASQIQKFNPVQPAYAQTGIGFEALQPIQKIWQVFRNISYVGFVIVFVIMGFMIMFRAHISPQTVATIQDSIPRIIVALILVTFSYAIAGLMIDLMFLLLNIIIGVLQSTGLLTGEANNVLTSNVFSIVFESWRDIIVSVFDAINKIIGDIVNISFIDAILGFLGGSIVAILAGIAILFIMFRVFLMLLMAYVTIIILTISAPFFFLVQALPGNNGAREWFRQMAANVSVFPTVALMFIFAGILSGLSNLGAPANPVIDPNQDIGQFPLLVGGISSEVVGKLIGLGFLLMTPEAANMVKNFLGVKGGPGFAGGASALGAAAGVAYTGSGLRGQVRGVQQGFATSSQERGERLVSRLPYFGSAVKERRRLLGLRQTE